MLYRAAEAQLGSAADSYLAKVLEGLANFLIGKGQTLTASGGTAASAFTIKNLILACHSGGGVAMQAFVEGLKTNTAALKGCWCFDCLYGKAAPVLVQAGQERGAVLCLLLRYGGERQGPAQADGARKGQGNFPKAAT